MPALVLSHFFILVIYCLFSILYVFVAKQLVQFFLNGYYKLFCMHHVVNVIHLASLWQMSAAAFAKGLLDLEGQLTPILVSKNAF